MRWVYRSHIGDGYVLDEKVEGDDLVCSLCGKKDELIGEATTNSELASLINDSGIRYSDLFAGELRSAGMSPINNEGIMYVEVLKGGE